MGKRRRTSGVGSSAPIFVLAVDDFRCAQRPRLRLTAAVADRIIGIVSVILWSLIVVVSFKYAILIMRADNRGEGGIVALLAPVPRKLF